MFTEFDVDDSQTFSKLANKNCVLFHQNQVLHFVLCTLLPQSLMNLCTSVQGDRVISAPKWG